MFQYVFSANVMVRVATRPAENPVVVVAKKLSLGKYSLLIGIFKRILVSDWLMMLTELINDVAGGVGGQVARAAPHLSLPGKLVFPSSHSSGHFSMLGLGDIVMPGLLLCFVMRYDAYKKAQHAKMADAGIPLPNNWTRVSYFHCSLFGYLLGLITATISSEVRKLLKRQTKTLKINSNQ